VPGAIAEKDRTEVEVEDHVIHSASNRLSLPPVQSVQHCTPFVTGPLISAFSTLSTGNGIDQLKDDQPATDMPPGTASVPPSLPANPAAGHKEICSDV
jgi:hypothetical protein